MTRDDDLWRMAHRFSDALEAGNQAAADRLARGWLQAQERLSLEVQTLLSKMEAARLAGVEVSPAWLYQERRLANLTDLVRMEMARYAPFVSDEVWNRVADARLAATSDARALTREAASVHLNGVEATFATINPANLAQQIAHLAPGGPLSDLLLSYGAEAAEAAEAALTQGVTLGKGTDWITRELKTALDIPRWRAETLARTEALRTYREVTRQTYLGSNVVGEWMWSASLDRRCCPACVGMHGTMHPCTETLDGHPRCRCAMIPRTLSWAQIDPSLADLPDTRVQYQTGVDWFAEQSAAYQRSLLGPLKFDAYQAGTITLPDVVARTYSSKWGTMRRERSMVEIRSGRNANYGPGVGSVLP